MAVLNKITGLVVGQYGTAITLQVVDDTGTVIDISSYTGITLRCTSDDGQKTLSFTGTLVGGGTTGQFSITPIISNTWDRKGTWSGQVEFAKTNVVALTVVFDMVVDRRV